MEKVFEVAKRIMDETNMTAVEAFSLALRMVMMDSRGDFDAIV
jgi:hypothetical protein